MSDFVKIYEVGLRDGLQNEHTPIDTDRKKELLSGLVSAGLEHIELTSFVHPSAVPQMADADVMMAFALATYHNQNIDFVGLVFNQIGYDRAFAAGCRSMAFGVAVSETFSRENTRMSSARALQTTRDLVKQARRDGVWIRVYIMTAWVCPLKDRSAPGARWPWPNNSGNWALTSYRLLTPLVRQTRWKLALSWMIWVSGWT